MSYLPKPIQLDACRRLILQRVLSIRGEDNGPICKTILLRGSDDEHNKSKRLQGCKSKWIVSKIQKLKIFVNTWDRPRSTTTVHVTVLPEGRGPNWIRWLRIFANLGPINGPIVYLFNNWNPIRTISVFHFNGASRFSWSWNFRIQIGLFLVKMTLDVNNFL